MAPNFPGQSMRLVTSEAADAAKQAAREAVAGYQTINPYTIGVAVEAALAVVMAPSADYMHLSAMMNSARASHPGPVPVADDAMIDAMAVDVTQRARLLEIVAEEVRRQHARDHAAMDCGVCTALEELDAAS